MVVLSTHLWCIGRVLWMPQAMGSVTDVFACVGPDRVSVECDFALGGVHASGVVLRSVGLGDVDGSGILTSELVNLSYVNFKLMTTLYSKGLPLKTTGRMTVISDLQIFLQPDLPSESLQPQK